MAASVRPEINQALRNAQQLRKTRLHRLLGWLLRVCQLFGVAPLKRETERRTNPSALTTTTAAAARAIVTQYLHHLWCVTLFLYICVANYLQSMRIPSDKPTVEKALYISVFLINCVIVVITMVNAQRKSEYFVSVPKEIEHLTYLLEQQQQKQQEQLQQHHHHHDYRPRLWNDEQKLAALNTDTLYRELRNLTALVSFFIACCFVLNLLLVDFNVVVWLRSSGAYNVPQVLISLNLGQHWLALRGIRQLYAGINECLRRLCLPPSLHAIEQECCWTGSNNKIYPFELEAAAWFRREIHYTTFPAETTLHKFLENLRNIYAQLDALNSLLIQQAFGLVLILNFLATFIELSVEMFSIYAYYDRPEEFTTILVIYKIIWIILHVGRMFFILLPNNAIIIEKCRTCFSLHQLNSLSGSMERAINRFLMQLMLCHKTESACGIIDLDLMLLGGMISALSMFIIFLIQIDVEKMDAIVDDFNETNTNL